MPIRNGLLVLGLTLGLAAACKKSEKAQAVAAPEAAPAEQAAATPSRAQVPVSAKPKDLLPGASDVRASLNKKDYTGAVGGLMALKGFAFTQEQAVEYGNLYGEVKSTLMEASQKDPKAAEALMTLRTANMGR
jgi:hypothetical protein